MKVINLGSNIPYPDAMAQMEALADRRRADLVPDTLMLLEHAPVFTLGTKAKVEHILLSAAECRAKGISIVKANRGGDVTYHGPGQLVGYPIVKIGTDPRAVVPYVTALEDVLIRAVARFGVAATRDKRNRGIWVGNSKLAAIGVHVAGGVTTHGFALNVNPDLSAYSGIIPCGLANAGITTLATLLPHCPAMDEVMNVVINEITLQRGIDVFFCIQKNRL